MFFMVHKIYFCLMFLLMMKKEILYFSSFSQSFNMVFQTNLNPAFVLLFFFINIGILPLLFSTTSTFLLMSYSLVTHSKFSKLCFHHLKGCFLTMLQGLVFLCLLWVIIFPKNATEYFYLKNSKLRSYSSMSHIPFFHILLSLSMSQLSFYLSVLSFITDKIMDSIGSSLNSKSFLSKNRGTIAFFSLLLLYHMILILFLNSSHFHMESMLNKKYSDFNSNIILLLAFNSLKIY